MKNLDKILEMKARVWQAYDSRLNFRRPRASEGCQEAGWMYCVILDTEKSFSEVEKIAASCGVEIRPFFYSVKEHTHLKDLQIIGQAQKLRGLPIMLPSYPELTLADIERVCEMLRSI